MEREREGLIGVGWRELRGQGKVMGVVIPRGNSVGGGGFFF